MSKTGCTVNWLDDISCLGHYDLGEIYLSELCEYCTGRHKARTNRTTAQKRITRKLRAATPTREVKP